jgi:hypothetical protein
MGIPISVLISTSEFRFRFRNSDFDLGISIIKIENLIFESNVNQCGGAASLLCGFGSISCSRAKISMRLLRLRLLPYYIPRPLFENKPKLTYGFGAIFSSDFLMIKKLTNINQKSNKTVTLCDIFNNLLM